MPYIEKNGDKFNLDSSGKANSSIIASEYDSSVTYNDGDLFIFKGKLYKVDSMNGNYLRSENLFTSASFDSGNGYLSAEQIKTDGGTYGRWSARTIGYTPVEAGKTYMYDYKRYGSMSSMAAIEFSNSSKTVLSRIEAGASNRTTTQFTAPANAAYGRFACGYESIEQTPTAELYEIKTNMPKVIEITIGTEITNKATISYVDSTETTLVENILQLIASTYDATSTYEVGDYCIYNNLLYKCNTTISTAEDFDDTKWDQTTLTELIKTLENQLNGFTIHSTMTQAQYDALSPDYDANTIYPVVG